VAAGTGRQPALAGHTLLVIGGSSGIGLETARRAHAEGADVIVTARDPMRVQLAGLEVDGSIAAFDATDFDRLGTFFDQLPSIDHVLVAGPRPDDVPLAELDVTEARRALEAHLLLPVQVAHRSATKVRPGGSLLFTGCIDGGPAGAATAFVTAITAALSSLTTSLAAVLAPIRVNLIAVGFIDTPGSATLLGDRLPARRGHLKATLPIGRVVGADDVAALAVHLMTNTGVTGATFQIDGGQRLVER
jgi:NAD(P)-dependent dehydrogenase (short-subunit alcohol dehydrogenase family)